MGYLVGLKDWEAPAAETGFSIEINSFGLKF